jgi:hypothetical protein
LDPPPQGKSVTKKEALLMPAAPFTAAATVHLPAIDVPRAGLFDMAKIESVAYYQ